MTVNSIKPFPCDPVGKVLCTESSSASSEPGISPRSETQSPVSTVSESVFKTAIPSDETRRNRWDVSVNADRISIHICPGYEGKDAAMKDLTALQQYLESDSSGLWTMEKKDFFTLTLRLEPGYLEAIDTNQTYADELELEEKTLFAQTFGLDCVEPIDDQKVPSTLTTILKTVQNREGAVQKVRNQWERVLKHCEQKVASIHDKIQEIVSKRIQDEQPIVYMRPPELQKAENGKKWCPKVKGDRRFIQSADPHRCCVKGDYPLDKLPVVSRLKPLPPNLQIVECEFDVEAKAKYYLQWIEKRAKQYHQSQIAFQANNDDFVNDLINIRYHFVGQPSPVISESVRSFPEFLAPPSPPELPASPPISPTYSVPHAETRKGLLGWIWSRCLTLIRFLARYISPKSY